MRAFGLVNRDRHGENTDSPAGHDATNEDHGKMLRCSLEYSSNQINDGAEQYRLPTAKTVHRETSPESCQNLFSWLTPPLTSMSRRMRPVCCQSPIGLARCPTYTGKCRIDSSYNVRLRICIEEIQEVRRLDDNCHHTGVVSEKETAIGSEHREQHVEEKTHLC